MITHNMKPYAVKERDAGLDNYAQQKNTFTADKTVDICVLLFSQTVNATTPRYKDSTHVGLTYDKSLTDNMTITNGTSTYLIQLVNNDGRMAQLTLKEVS